MPTSSSLRKSDEIREFKIYDDDVDENVTSKYTPRGRRTVSTMYALNKLVRAASE